MTDAIVEALKAAGEDFEWYPTTDLMIAAIRLDLQRNDYRAESFLDVGAGDGRVLMGLAAGDERKPKLYGIEKSPILQQQQPTEIIPIGTEFFEQDLMGLPVDVLFCNPPYSAWSARPTSDRDGLAT